MISEALLREIESGREGKSQGLTMGLPKLEEIVDGVTRGTYTLLFAGSGIGNKEYFLKLWCSKFFNYICTNTNK